MRTAIFFLLAALPAFASPWRFSYKAYSGLVGDHRQPAIAADGDGNVFFAPAGRLVKVRATGEMAWDKAGLDDSREGRSIRVEKGGTILVGFGDRAARFSADGVLVKDVAAGGADCRQPAFGEGGQVYWVCGRAEVRIASPDFSSIKTLALGSVKVPFFEVTYTASPAGDFLVAGTAWLGPDTTSPSEVRVFSISPEGQVRWAKTMPSFRRQNEALAVEASDRGEVWIAIEARGYQEKVTVPAFVHELVIVGLDRHGEPRWAPVREVQAAGVRARHVAVAPGSGDAFFVLAGIGFPQTWQILDRGEPGWKDANHFTTGSILQDVVATSTALYSALSNRQWGFGLLKRDHGGNWTGGVTQWVLKKSEAVLRNGGNAATSNVAVAGNGAAYVMAAADFFEDPKHKCDETKVGQTHWCRYPRFLLLRR